MPENNFCAKNQQNSDNSLEENKGKKTLVEKINEGNYCGLASNMKYKQFLHQREELTPKEKQSSMVEVDNNIDVKSKIKWFEKKEQINGTIQYYISNFLQENFEKISHITFEMWVSYVNQEPSINLDSQKLNTITFEQYRKLWFLSKFKMTYREYF